MTESVRIELSGDEALVLFEFLSRYSDSDALVIEDPAEQRVLWRMCCALESKLVEPLEKEYDELLRQARERVRTS